MPPQVVLSQLTLDGLPEPPPGELEVQLLRADEAEPIQRVPLRQEKAHGTVMKSITIILSTEDSQEECKEYKLVINAMGAGPEPPEDGVRPDLVVGTALLEGVCLREEDGDIRDDGEYVAAVTLRPPPEAEPAAPAKGKGKGAAPKVEETPELPACTIQGWWRQEAALPDMRTQIAPPLALSYAVPANREALLERNSLWREEMCEANGMAHEGTGAHHRWQPAAPVKPSYLKGDISSRQVRSQYIQEKNQDRILLSAQAVQREYDVLVTELLACVTAVQASECLGKMKEFVLSAANLTMIEVDSALKQLNKLHLPFERLVRNVWVEGPEVAYDRTKASLIGILSKEIAARKAEAAYKGDSEEKFGPRELVPSLVHELHPELHHSPFAKGPPVAPPPPSVTRVGLVSFHGSKSTKQLPNSTKQF